MVEDRGAILVDLDDVIYPTRENVHLPAIREVKRILATNLLVKPEMIDFWFEGFLRSAYETLGVDINSLWNFTLGWCSLVWGVEVGGELWQRLMGVLLDQYFVNPGVYDDAFPALGLMRDLGKKLISVSHCEGSMRGREGWGPRKVRMTEMTGMFDKMLFADPLLFRHKDEGVFEWVIQQIGIGPRQTWLIDDNFRAVVAARNLGINAVQLDRGSKNWSVYWGNSSQVPRVENLLKFVDLVRRGGDSNPR